MGEVLVELENFLMSDPECVLSTVFNTIRTEWINYNNIVSTCSFAEPKKVYTAINKLYSKKLIEKKGLQYRLSSKGLELLENINR
jgi:predicted transcriptional regulator